MQWFKRKTAFFIFIVICLLGISAFVLFRFYVRYFQETKILKQVIARLEAESRIAEVLVTDVKQDESSGKMLTTIKFLEYDTQGRPLEAQYFTFSGNVIQFQSLVVRFDDLYVRQGHSLKGKSAYLFWKVFMLDGSNTEEFEISKVRKVPEGYKIEDLHSPVEDMVWDVFWDYALDPSKASKVGIKNAQIEAPGTLFVPGTLYTLIIEHDGGIRIDAAPLSPILKGEHIPEWGGI